MHHGSAPRSHCARTERRVFVARTVRASNGAGSRAAGRLATPTITTVDVRRFIKHRQDEKASNGEINRELAYLKRMFTLAVQSAKLMSRPYIPMLKENNIRKEFFEREQFENVRIHLPAHMPGVASFAYVTG
jgi:hypothetical protein